MPLAKSYEFLLLRRNLVLKRQEGDYKKSKNSLFIITFIQHESRVQEKETYTSAFTFLNHLHSTYRKRNSLQKQFSLILVDLHTLVSYHNFRIIQVGTKIHKIINVYFSLTKITK